MDRPDPRLPASLTLRTVWLEPGPTAPSGRTVQRPRWLVAHEALFVVQLARMGTRHEVVPLDVTLPVPPEARAEYEAYLGTPLRRGEPLTVRFSRADGPFHSRRATSDLLDR